MLPTGLAFKNYETGMSFHGAVKEILTRERRGRPETGIFGQTRDFKSLNPIVKPGLCVCLDPSKAQVKSRVLDGLEFSKNQPPWVFLSSRFVHLKSWEFFVVSNLIKGMK